jgi:hypothetical protein
MKYSNIKFTNISGLNDIFPPEPAIKNIPEWYIDADSYIGGIKKPNKNHETPATIKRCMPVFDSITMGYILKTPVDIYVSNKMTDNGHVGPSYEWPSLDTIKFHGIEQALDHPLRNGQKTAYAKWMNPWSIKTDPGYSCLFIQPMHRDCVFNIFPGVVDTDKYFAPVNLPFVLLNKGFEGLIPAGTPIAQVIPFKRDAFQMSFGSEKDLQDQGKNTMKLKTRFFDSYKSQFRQIKEYR